MSLVNDMLRDLDKRGQGNQTVPGDEPLRMVVREKRRSVFSLPVLSILALLLTALLFLLWRQGLHLTAGPAVSDQVLSLNPASKKAVSVPPAPDVKPPVRVQRFEWQLLPSGVELRIDFNQSSEVVLISQSPQALVISFPGAQLKSPLPLPSGDVISNFNVKTEAQRLVLVLNTVRDAAFELIRITETQLNIRVQLLAIPEKPRAVVKAQPVVKPEPVAKAPVPAAIKPRAVSATGAERPQSPEARPVKAAPVPKSEKTLPEAKTTAPQQTKASARALPRMTDEQVVSKARQLLQKNQTNAAVSWLNHQLNQQPDFSETRILLAGVYLAEGNGAEAESLVTQGLKKTPASAGLKKIKARLLLAAGEAQAAADLLRLSAPAITRDAEYHEIKAVALQRLGRADEAINLYYQLLNYNSRQARLWVGLGYSLELAARWPDARKAYQNSLQIPDLDANLKSFVTQRLQQLAER
ncbi:MAG: tetratricopeptide repeat protein [Pontibacterium sp.]